jgi:hypothetical protein
MDAKCVATRGDARNQWTSADPRERPAPGWGISVGRVFHGGNWGSYLVL